LLFQTAGIDDDDQEFTDYNWTYESVKPGQRVTYPLNADRFWVQPQVLEGDASGRCVASGVRANIWARARRRGEITHNLRSGGRNRIGWGALKWQETLISKLGGKVMEVMVVMNWEVMNSCSNGSNEEVIALQNDHAVMKMAHGVMM
jgi:hypothetical protein